MNAVYVALYAIREALAADVVKRERRDWQIQPTETTTPSYYAAARDENGECAICGGTAGRLVDGMHLCAARKRAGLSTPNLGYHCQDCNGTGHPLRYRGGVFLFADIGAAAIGRSIAAQFPPCPTCNGRGYTTGDKVADAAMTQVGS